MHFGIIIKTIKGYQYGFFCKKIPLSVKDTVVIGKLVVKVYGS